MSEEPKRLDSKDLVHHPGTKPLTRWDLEAMQTRHANAIRPIPSTTAMGHEHLMADADRGSLLAEVERLQAEVDQLRAQSNPFAW